ncbi:MAG: molybdopterin-dependent oxidoreductase, partial [Mycobacterium leprae]
GALEFLLLNHPLDCPVCDKGGECDLQDLTLAYGPSTSRLQEAKTQKPKTVELGNFIVLDNERCILCRRCVRFDDQIATEGNLIIEERAHFNLITTLENQPYDSYFSGNTIELCPVGALTSETYRFQARPWDLAKVDSICHGCSVGCNVTEEFRHGKLLRLQARDNAEVDQGWMCDRGRFNYKFVHQDDRITEPLMKKDGQLVPVSWKEALTAIAEQFKAVKATVGGNGLGVIGGGKLTNEEAYLLQKFARLTLGTNNIDHRTGSQQVASIGAFPGRQADLSDAGAIIVVDTDPAETAPVMDLRIRRMVDRKKAKLALIGTNLPKYRGRHARVQVKPGQTPAVLSALAATAAGRQAGACAADADTLAQLLKLTQAATKVVLVWNGEDAATGRALVELAAALKKPASNGEAGRSVHVLIPGAQNNSRGAEAMGALPGFLPGYAAVTDAKAVERFAQLWQARNLSAQVGLSTEGMLKAAAAGEVKALYLAGANLMNTYPDRKLVEAALANSFVVVADLFLNETAAKADVVLPVATISEKAGTWTNLDGLVQSTKVAKKAEGSAQPDGDIIVGIASMMGSRLANSPAETAGEIAKAVTVKLAEGVVLTGAPNAMLTAAEAVAAASADLVLVPVDRLYAGGSTAQFDKAFSHVLPKAEAFFNPIDSARLGLKDGDLIALDAGSNFVTLTVKTEKRVVAGTVQAIRGLTAAPLNTLTSTGSAPVAVTVRKLTQEVAD